MVLGSVTFREPNPFFRPQFPNLQIAKEQTQAVGPVVWMNPSPHSGCLRGDGWEQPRQRCGASESTGDTEDSSLSLEPNLNSNHLLFLAIKPSQKRRCRPNGSSNTKFSRRWEGQFWCKGNHGSREDIGQEDGGLKLGHGYNVVDFRAPTVKGVYPRPAPFPKHKNPARQGTNVTFRLGCLMDSIEPGLTGGSH